MAIVLLLSLLVIGAYLVDAAKKHKPKRVLIGVAFLAAWICVVWLAEVYWWGPERREFWGWVMSLFG